MKVSDYVFKFLSDKGITNMFYLPGGGCMHLLDSLGKSEKIHAFSLLHEQSVAVATESYANTTGRPAACLVTTGPGATNTVTGVLAAHLDSTPCMFISGQVKTVDLKSNYGVRSLGSQEADIVSIVSPITKYASMITDKSKIRYELERAWYEMTSGRRGVVWIDIPLDIQGAEIDIESLEGFVPHHTEIFFDLNTIIDALNSAERPVIIAGNGLSMCKNKFHELIEYLKFPVIPTWKAIDYIANDDPLYAGRAGGMGDRHGNLTMQNADLLFVLGSRLDFSITGYDRSEWAPKAKKIVVDIDKAEIDKLKFANSIIPVVADVSDVINDLLKNKNKLKTKDLTIWKKYINYLKQKYPIAVPNNLMTTYAFVKALCKYLPSDALVAPCSSGTTVEILFQAFILKKGQTIRSNHGLGSMGFELPNAIGMCVASDYKPTVCIAGDGGVQLNIQELAIISGRKLPIKIFVINNKGYASIRNMQNNHFEGHYVGCDESSGLFLPSFKALAYAYGLDYCYSDKIETLEKAIKKTLSMNCAAICEIIVEKDSIVTPRTTTITLKDGSLKSSPLENQYPFLMEAETIENFINEKCFR